MNHIDTLISFKRINVIGSPGSGKSTLANKLGKYLNIEVHDLDDILYDKDGKRLNSTLSALAVDNLLSNDTFIIDGTYTTTFKQRLNYLDLVIMTDGNTMNNILAFAIRLITNNKLKFGERLTLKTMKLLLTFNSKIKSSLINSTKEAGVRIAIFNRKKDELIWLN